MVEAKSWRNLFRDAELKLTENHAQEKGQYIALSYCWGSTLAYKTTNQNLESHKKAILFKHLPKTLQDAITITRYLDMRYLWIDCLSIVQDDKADWQREAARMADIYSNSYLTITAARASDSSQGFLSPRKIKSMEEVLVEDENGSFRLYFYVFDVSFSPGSFDSTSLEPLKVYTSQLKQKM